MLLKLLVFYSRFKIKQFKFNKKFEFIITFQVTEAEKIYLQMVTGIR
jgi:hypothetical protein